MSSAELNQLLTARVFLLGKSDSTDTTEVLAHSLNEHGIADSAIESLSHLPASALDAVHREIAAVADGFLDLDLGSVLLSGWRKYKELTDAAKRTLATPGSEEVVVLAAHRVSSTHHPTVDVLIDGVKIHSFVFELNVVFDLNGVVAVVRLGQLVKLRGAECVITVSLTLEGIPLMPSRKKNIDLGLVVQLDSPIQLVSIPSASPTPGAPASRRAANDGGGAAPKKDSTNEEGRAPDWLTDFIDRTGSAETGSRAAEDDTAPNRAPRSSDTPPHGRKWWQDE